MTKITDVTGRPAKLTVASRSRRLPVIMSRYTLLVLLFACGFAAPAAAGYCSYVEQCNFWTCTGEVSSTKMKDGSVSSAGRAVRTCWKFIDSDPDNLTCPRKEWEEEQWLAQCAPKLKMRPIQPGKPRIVTR